jgi:hypothetical protein
VLKTSKTAISRYPVSPEPCRLPAEEPVLQLVDGLSEVHDLHALQGVADVTDGNVRDPVVSLGKF